MTYPNLNILTYAAKAVQSETEYYTPVATVSGELVGTFYAFLGRVDPWPTDSQGVEVPELPNQSQKYIKQTFKNIFAAKRLYTSNFSLVIPRIDWVANTVYYAYDDKTDIFEKDINGFIARPFYVKNRYDQVFKCLSNNNGAVSTYEPYFQPGSYGTNNIYENADLYKWKYMYTINTAAKRDFLDSNWIPVPVGANTPQPHLTSAGYGDIEVINVTNGGSGYDPINSYIVATITGDGTGASANITSSQVVNGQIVDVVVGNPGKNYTNANVTIQAYTSANQKYLSPIGTGATAVSPVSPVGGHAYDAPSELGCSHIMFSVQFNGSENEYIPTNATYRQVGLLIDPIDYGSYPEPATNPIYDTSTKFVVAAGSGVFSNGETVQQQDASGTVIFSGKVLSFDTAGNVLRVINTTGTYVQGQLIKGLSSYTSRVVFSVTDPTLIPLSGHLAYIENRNPVERSADGIELFKFILGY